MKTLKGKKVVLAVTGSVSAYKAVEILRELQKRKALVRVAMTPSARRFVTPFLFESLSQQPVYCADSPEAEHIQLSGWAELLLIAPATANTIAKIAGGIADDPVTLLALCLSKGIICPAMNERMYENPVTRRNVEFLKSLGWEAVGPYSGELACGGKGTGRLADVEDIISAVSYWFTPKLLGGKKVLVTAGATREYIDPVRFISNPSSGKMGFAIAKVARAMGADVTLVTGPTHLRTPYLVRRIDVETVEQMKEVVLKEFEDADMYISAAAVGDFKPVKRFTEKLRKESTPAITLELERTTDILKVLSTRKSPEQVLVGFSAVTGDPVGEALKKLRNKRLNAIVGNDITRGVFGSDSTSVVFIDRHRQVRLAGSKEDVAFEILKLLSETLQ
jgi:phosphopantothenoylcysteine decarboxylase/phosphopantothenate--cysteine ligase